MRKSLFKYILYSHPEIGLVPEFHVLISVQNSAVFVLYLGRYIQISGAFRRKPSANLYACQDQVSCI
jgi:hypothetical protein